MIKKECLKKSSDTKIKVSEKGKSLIFENNGRYEFLILRVDDCVIKVGKRCDYIVSRIGCSSVLIELKGGKVKHACEQLFATIEQKCIKDCCERQIGFVVICNRYPSFDSFVLKAKQRAMKKYSAHFHVYPCNKKVDILDIC